MPSPPTTRNSAPRDPSGPRNYVLSPSGLTFLWEECPRCFYMQIKYGMKRPSIPMPGVFNSIDSAMKNCFMLERTETTPLGLPAGIFAYTDEWVMSSPIAIPGRTSTVTFRGKFDTALLFDDGTSGMSDFKCSSPRASHIPLYSRQLHAYTFAVEKPASGRLALPYVSQMGLIVFEPQRFRQRTDTGNGIAGYFGGGLSWVPVQRDDNAFLNFLIGVVSVLDGLEPPSSSPNCPYCKFLRDYEQFTH